MTEVAISRTEQLAEQIRRRIIAEALGDGDLFMTEAQLAEEYGVSRNIAREAVSQLRGLGILEGRKSKGLLVRRPNPVKLLSHSLPGMAQTEEDVNELAKLRYVLEIGAIELAVNNATDEQVQRLKQLATEYEQARKDHASLERQVELELAFHGLILEMTGSTLVSGMQQTLGRFFVKHYGHGTGMIPPAATDDRGIWQHHAIAAAIGNRDLEGARALIRLHFEGMVSGGTRK
jgi:GntR family transcriptional regulator, transcriptional repressor for pyruvate dehydrogenase complex